LDSEVLVILLFLVVVLLVAPILAIAAWIRVRRLERRGPDAINALTVRLNALDERLAELERASTALRATRPASTEAAAGTPAAPAQPPAAAPAPPAATEAAPPPTAAALPPSPPPEPPHPAPFVAREIPSPAPSRPAPAGLDMESLIGGRWLNRIGIAALLLAASFLLKYAYDNNWIGPTGIVALEMLAGVALIAWSQWLLGRGYRFFSEGIAGLGAGVIYFSLYSAWDLYHLVPQAASFAGMVVVTAAMTAIALGRDSQRIALLALVGGLASPMLVSTGTDQQVFLFTYLAILDAGLLALARRRDWRTLEFLAFLGTQIYFWGWYGAFYADEKLARTAAFAALIFALFAALPVIRARRLAALPASETTLVLFNAFWFLLALRAMLWPGRKWELTLAVLVLAAAHLVVAQRAPEPETGGRAAVRLLFAGLALTFVTLAIPIRLEGRWITMAWAIEGLVLAWSGFRARLRGLRAAALVLFAITAFRLWAFEIPADQLFLNPRFAAFTTAVACFAAAFYFSRQQRAELGRDEAAAFGLVGIGVNVFLLWALSLELSDAYAANELARQLSLSLLWTLYATALMVLGVRQASAALRWQGLALFGLVVGKVFLYDLSFLRTMYRIVSFVVLGVVLLVVSFLYQRRLARQRSEEP
jgi:uncharacterized membrane protein